MKRRHLATALLVSVWVGGSSGLAQAQKVYWCGGGSNTIHRADLDGSNPEIIIGAGLSTPDGLAIDQVNGKIYWAEQGGDIKRANLDGSAAETIFVAGGSPDSVALDVPAGKVYWSESANNRICRSNLDGTSVEILITTNTANVHGIALDPGAGKIYWAQLSAGLIHRSDLDGSNHEQILSSVSGPHGLAIDTVADKLYWTDLNTDRIQRSNLDGTGVENLVTSGLAGPATLAVSRKLGKIYFTDLSDGRLRRANLDGSNVEILISGLNFPLGVGVEVSQGVPATGLVALWPSATLMVLIALVAAARMRPGRRPPATPAC